MRCARSLEPLLGRDLGRDREQSVDVERGAGQMPVPRIDLGAGKWPEARLFGAIHRRVELDLGEARDGRQLGLEREADPHPLGTVDDPRQLAHDAQPRQLDRVRRSRVREVRVRLQREQ